MDFEKSSCLEKIYREVDITPEEYLPALLEIVKGFRIGVIKPADESFRQGMQDVMENRTRPVSELWEGIDACYSKLDQSDVSAKRVKEILKEMDEKDIPA